MSTEEYAADISEDTRVMIKQRIGLFRLDRELSFEGAEQKWCIITDGPYMRLNFNFKHRFAAFKRPSSEQRERLIRCI